MGVTRNFMIDDLNINEIKSIFQEKMLECETESGSTLMCSINEAFEEFHKDGHNCLGCNLQDSVDMINSFLETAENYNYKEHFSTIYIMVLYLLTERVLEIKKIIGLPETYREDVFKILREVKLWANFHKHPKAFILTHHPSYIFENEFNEKDYKEQKIIDGKFLKKYYSGEDKNKYINLVSELKNNNNVIVVLPDFKRVTEEICECFKVFIQLIKDNPVYRNILNDLTTLEYHFENEEL